MKIVYVYKEWFHRFKIFGQIMEQLGHEVVSCELNNNKVSKSDVEWCDVVWVHKPQFLDRIPENKKFLVTYNPTVKEEKEKWAESYEPFNLVFIPNKYEVKELKRLSNEDKFIYIPWGFDERRYYPEFKPKTIDISYAGSAQKDEKRVEWFLKIKEQVPIKFFGEQVCRVTGSKIKKYDSHEEQRAIYQATKCNIDCPITNERRDFIPYQKMRFFEIPACGEILLTYYSDEFAELFEPEVEMFYYSSLDEFVGKARDIVKYHDILMPHRIAAAKRAREEHTFKKRFERMLVKIEGSL